ncbi:hypothetical protein M595_2693 [Lyngbya aestuarii BL J]|uniref:Uncharacterized protein n=1 Tax=Lyngbya aestuarii BL J TaxID=1348334 RepID=U7QHB4_9CYAN|nr:hypothetical protein M595_2693 [Lyngbya aestuarii BL J]
MTETKPIGEQPSCLGATGVIASISISFYQLRGRVLAEDC